MKVKLARQSGLELLRIISMIMIVAAHLSQRGNWAWAEADASLSFNHYLMNIVICFGQVGVAIFFTITGYFLHKQKPKSWKRLSKVVCPTWFYSLLFLVVALILTPSSINFSLPLNSVLAHLLFPITTNAYWFISTYIALFLLLPYIKKWLDNLNNTELFKIIAIIAGLFIVPNTISYIVADVPSLIFTIPAALFYTIVGYTIHRNSAAIMRLKQKALILITFSGIILYAVASLLIHFAITKLNYTNINNSILVDTMSLPCMLVSIPLVICFSRLNFTSRFINYLASLVFGIYLIHSNTIFITIVWKQHDLLRTFEASSYSPIHFVLYFLLTTAIVFLFSAVIEALRKALVRLIKLLKANL